MAIIEKQCKHCGLTFKFDYVSNGKGSGNRLRRPYCSEQCAELHRRVLSRLPLPSRLKKICIECEREFFVAKCLHHRNLCSNACRYKHNNRTRTKHHVMTLCCVVCESDFITKQTTRKYCSAECAARGLLDRVMRKCEVCMKSFETKRSYVPRFCSKHCTYVAQSKGMVASHVNGRSGFRTDIVNSPYFKSSFEADYYRYCLQVLKETPLYEHKTIVIEIDDVRRCYTPDFWFQTDGSYVELKGVREGESLFSKLLNSNSRVRDTAVSMGYPIRVIYMNDFYRELQDKGLYSVITNLEHRDYAGTKHLIRKHGEDRIDQH